MSTGELGVDVLIAIENSAQKYLISKTMAYNNFSEKPPAYATSINKSLSSDNKNCEFLFVQMFVNIILGLNNLIKFCLKLVDMPPYITDKKQQALFQPATAPPYADNNHHHHQQYQNNQAAISIESTDLGSGAYDLGRRPSSKCKIFFGVVAFLIFATIFACIVMMIIRTQKNRNHNYHHHQFHHNHNYKHFNFGSDYDSYN